MQVGPVVQVGLVMRVQQKQDPGSNPNGILSSPLQVSGLSVGDCGDAAREMIGIPP